MATDGSLSPAVILTHDNTDFDALASELAAHKLYPQATPVVPTRLNRNVREFLSLYADALPFVEARALGKERLALAIVVDTQSVSPVRGMDAETSLLIIDHHPRSAHLPENAAFEGEPLGATTTLLVERLRVADVPLTTVEASLLLLGIYEDTGSLIYQSTTPRDLEAAAWLLEHGASLTIVERFLRTPLTHEQQALYSFLVNEAEFMRVQERTIIVASVHLEHYVEELAALVHKLVDLFDPDACFLLAEYQEHVQVIARSTTDAIDVGAILRQMRGGGHAKAAAAVIPDSSLDSVRDQLADLLRIHVQPAVTVAQVMSYGVHTLSPNLTIAEANARMRRYGHEGFPVVEGGRLVGVLTRSEIDRALHHNLGSAPVRAYMRAGAVSVSPHDSIGEVQRIMMEHSLGQVPVVQDGRVLGIVTRTDLIKLWSAPPRPSRQAQIADLLGQTLPGPLIELLLAARDQANDLGYSLYVVGGFVRDLLLGHPTLDLDLVVEGDAIALARQLAEQLGGQVRSHGRFGTAKLILPEDRPSGQPASLDFVTARTEFYAHPTALPQVERSSIKQDLYRRDFTINTMAICLDRARYGELLDYYGGERDLLEKLVRVLHSLSFVEDPTRMLRAVRFEQRLGFRIEARTEELLRGALDLLDRVSGDRLRHELLHPARACARAGLGAPAQPGHPAAPQPGASGRRLGGHQATGTAPLVQRLEPSPRCRRNVGGGGLAGRGRGACALRNAGPGHPDHAPRQRGPRRARRPADHAPQRGRAPRGGARPVPPAAPAQPGPERLRAGGPIAPLPRGCPLCRVGGGRRRPGARPDSALPVPAPPGAAGHRWPAPARPGAQAGPSLPPHPRRPARRPPRRHRQLARGGRGAAARARGRDGTKELRGWENWRNGWGWPCTSPSSHSSCSPFSSLPRTPPRAG